MYETSVKVIVLFYGFHSIEMFCIYLFHLGTNTKAIHQCGRRLLLLAKSRLLMMPKNLDLNSEKHRKEALQVRDQCFCFLKSPW